MVLLKMMLRRKGHDFVRKDLTGRHGYELKIKRGNEDCRREAHKAKRDNRKVIPYDDFCPIGLGVCSSTCSSQAQGNTQARQQTGKTGTACSTIRAYTYVQGYLTSAACVASSTT